MILLHFWLPGL